VTDPSNWNLGSPEAHVLGVQYTPYGYPTTAPLTVVDAGDSLFHETGVSNGSAIGRCSYYSAPGGASGIETDKIAAASPGNVVLLAQGGNTPKGADVVFYTLSNGGAVFSGSSMTFTGSVLISSLVANDPLSRVVMNALTNFGIVPTKT
jgi:hypothetical protein